MISLSNHFLATTICRDLRIGVLKNIYQIYLKHILRTELMSNTNIHKKSI